MTLARTRLVVIVFGLAVLAAIIAGLAVVGGPGTGRRDRRDAVRLDALRQVAEAVRCHVVASAEPERPATLAEVSPACLTPDAARRLVDPRTGAAFRIDYPAPHRAAVCAGFEAPIPEASASRWLPLDAESGCVSIGLTPG